MSATPGDLVHDAQQLVAELRRQLQEARAALAVRDSAYSERISYQAAANEVLKLMAAKPGEPQPVFDLIVERARDLCDGYGATLYQFDGTLIYWRAATGVSDDPSKRQAVQSLFPMKPTREWPAGYAIIDRKVIHIRDLDTEPGLTPAMRGLTVKSAVVVPMMRGDLPLGAISLGSRKVGGFTEPQVELLKTFADQAVIAIENARLFDQVQARSRDLEESLQQQTATADVLKVISRSAFALQPVLDTLIESATRLCQADHAWIFLRNGDHLRWAASFGHNTEVHQRIEAFFKPLEVPIDRGSITGRAAQCGQVVHVADVLADPDYTWNEAQKIGGYRAALGVPLLREGQVIGIIFIGKYKPVPFSEKQIELVTTFADQAVIAIQNVRLFEEVQARTRELTEALVHQTASGAILRAIASARNDVAPVLQTIAETACNICDAHDAVVTLAEGGNLRIRAHHGPIPEGIDTWPITRNWAGGRSYLERRPVHLSDLLAVDENEFPDSRELSRRMGGMRCVLSVPLLREGESIGTIAVRRMEPRAFTEKQVGLIQTFADQAVIGIENARLFNEVRARTEELQEALDSQTASANILRVIAGSPTEVQPVLDVIVESALRLCEAVDAAVLLREGDELCFRAHKGSILVARERLAIDRGFTVGRALVDRTAVHVRDVLSAEGDEFPASRDMAGTTGARGILSVPLLREGESIGVVLIRRADACGFSEKQIELLQTFADQGVIAIENARLFEEVQARTEDLRESLKQQTATADVLKTISRSAFDLKAVLQTLVQSVATLVGADRGTIAHRRGDAFYREAFYGFSQAFRERLAEIPLVPERGSASGRALLEGQIVHIENVHTDPEYTLLERVQLDEIATILGVPMLRDGEPIGVLVLTRDRARAFAEKEIALVSTFADQAAIAIANVRLFEQVQSRTRQLEQTLDELRSAQDRLVQTEKLASLGQLTAGIAHELKNPLNFVNNFSSLSAELVDELGRLLERAPLTQEVRTES
ncbi:MAG: GAF domain-containing protein, partial [Methylobacteriaceae bacterium]|nr:GAF domain-containing protein [Methylobacteriaceae bacterium]